MSVPFPSLFGFLWALTLLTVYSYLAQSVERMTVNHDVAGSSPAGGATSQKGAMKTQNLLYAPLAQLVEQLTLNQWVQGSSPWRCTTYSSIAQSVERMTVNHDVTGSSPVWGAIFILEGFPSGQRGRTVNPLALPSKVRILLPPSYIYASL